MIIAYHSAALRELTEIAHYYEQRLPNLGSDFLDELDHVLSVVLENPHIGVVFNTPFRRILLQRFPFAVFYLVDNDFIRVVAIAHQHRKPGYWKSRR